MRQSGIYKITNPNGQAYIGQSVDLKKRLMTYMGVKLVYNQPKIYESLKQHGSEAHQYDILERCECAELDVKEAEYKQQFVNKHGWDKALFCWLNDPPTREEKRARQQLSKHKPKVKHGHGYVMRHFLNGTLENILYDDEYNGVSINDWQMYNIKQQLIA